MRPRKDINSVKLLSGVNYIRLTNIVIAKLQ